MKATRFALGSILFVALFATASIAQNGRTFVSGTGLDTNPCSLTAPCRTFTQAISQTNAGGEVVVLTAAGGYFILNTKSSFDEGDNPNDYKTIREAYILNGEGNVTEKRTGGAEDPVNSQTSVQGEDKYVFDTPGGAISGGAGYITAGMIARDLDIKPWWKAEGAAESLVALETAYASA